MRMTSSNAPAPRCGGLLRYSAAPLLRCADGWIKVESPGQSPPRSGAVSRRFDFVIRVSASAKRVQMSTKWCGSFNYVEVLRFFYKKRRPRCGVLRRDTAPPGLCPGGGHPLRGVPAVRLCHPSAQRLDFVFFFKKAVSSARTPHRCAEDFVPAIRL
jgi:hypothetical protein